MRKNDNKSKKDEKVQKNKEQKRLRFYELKDRFTLDSSCRVDKYSVKKGASWDNEWIDQKGAKYFYLDKDKKAKVGDPATYRFIEFIKEEQFKNFFKAKPPRELYKFPRELSLEDVPGEYVDKSLRKSNIRTTEEKSDDYQIGISELGNDEKSDSKCCNKPCENIKWRRVALFGALATATTISATLIFLSYATFPPAIVWVLVTLPTMAYAPQLIADACAPAAPESQPLLEEGHRAGSNYRLPLPAKMIFQVLGFGIGGVFGYGFSNASYLFSQFAALGASVGAGAAAIGCETVQSVVRCYKNR